MTQFKLEPKNDLECYLCFRDLHLVMFDGVIYCEGCFEKLKQYSKKIKELII